MYVENFEQSLKNKEKMLVLFYASWCPFSQEFLPIFKNYAKSNPDKYMSVMIDNKSDLCEKYSIKYYPTVLFFKKGIVEKRLDGKPGEGLTEQQLTELTTILR